jgi:two-component system, LytTR family, response regulator
MESKITAIVVDDEANARIALKGILAENFENVKVIGEASNIPEAIKLINNLKPQVLFLDIEMPGYSGLDILDFFSPEQITFQIIFVSAYNNYAINAFEISAIDYILKPIQIDDLKRAISKLNTNSQVANLNLLRDNLSNDKLKKIVINSNSGQTFVEIENIILVKAEGAYSQIYFLNGDKILVSKKLIEFEKLEFIGRFMRLHRSYIVNLNHIKAISKKNGYTVEMINGHEVPVSKEKIKDLNDNIIEPKF